MEKGYHPGEDLNHQLDPATRQTIVENIRTGYGDERVEVGDSVPVDEELLEEAAAIKNSSRVLYATRLTDEEALAIAKSDRKQLHQSSND